MRAEGVQRASRVQWAALAVLFAGILALPVRLASGGSAEHLRTAPADITVSATTTTSVPPAATAPSEPLAGEQAITPPPDGAFGDDIAPLYDDAAPGDPVAVAPVEPTTPVMLEGGSVPATATNVFALVIGINDYPGTRYDLHAAVADADDMAAALLHYGVPAANIDLLTDSNADAASIVRGLHWLTRTAGPDSTVVLSYSGHARKLGSTTEAIVSSDGVPIADWYLARQLAPLQARDTWIVMAACYGGGFDELLAPGRILTAAADANSIAYESSDFGRSYLDEYLVRRGLLLGQAGGPTVQQAFQWAQAMLLRDSPDRSLTQLDDSTEPISLDGRHRSSVPPTAPLAPAGAPPTSGGGTSSNGGNGGGAGPRGGLPMPTTVPPPPTTPAPKECFLYVFCG